MKALATAIDTFWKALGLPRPDHQPAALGWAETLAVFYAVFGILLGLAPFLPVTADPKDGYIVVFLASSVLGMALPMVLVLLATRRGWSVANWIAIALLLQPGVRTGRRIIDAPESISTISFPLAVLLIVSLTTASLLLLPASRAWMKQRRAELKRAKHKEAE